MKTEITCPCCGQEYDIDKSIIGQTVKCEECGTMFTATTVEKNHPSLKVRKPKKVVVSVVIGGVCLLALLLVGILMFPRVKSNIDYKKGLEAQKEHRYDAAFELFKKAANYGHPEAQFELGCCYGGAEGTVSDIPEAIKWFRKAAEQGHMEAQYRLGLFYQTGLGMNKSETEALFWFEKAAEQGHKEAPYRCGICCFNPAETSFDQLYYQSKDEYYHVLALRALPWYMKAAELESQEACYNIGLLYEYGLGVDKDYHEAIKWFQKAGSFKGAIEVNICEKLLESQDNDPEKQAKMAEMFYLFGHEMESIEWYRMAAEQGNMDAQGFLAFIESNTVSSEEAQKWRQAIAETKREQQLKEQLQREKEAVERAQMEMSDDDSDGFTYIREINAGTDPKDPFSHPKYVTLLVSSVGLQNFPELKFMGVNGKGKRYYDRDLITDIEYINKFDGNKKNIKVGFQVVNNNNKSLKSLKIGDKFKNNNIEFVLDDIDLRAIMIGGVDTPISFSRDLEIVAYIHRSGKKEKILCQIGEPILDPTIRVVLRNSLNSSEFTIAIGETFKLGDAKTGEEEYKVVSANITTREVVVESIDSSKTRYSIRPRISLP